MYHCQMLNSGYVKEDRFKMHVLAMSGIASELQAQRAVKCMQCAQHLVTDG